MAPPAAAAKRNSSTLPPGYVEDKSKGPMLRFQESLPRLPVPTLEETAARYLKSLRPLLSDEKLAHSTKAVESFIAPGGPGQKLQEKLLARREDPKHKNWLYDWWNEAAYLAYRDPVVPYVSYFYSYRDDRRRTKQTARAAAITTAALEFKKQVDQGTLEPEYMKGLPICMDSYQYMFHACRVPAVPADHPVKYDPAENKHIIVIAHGRFYKVAYEAEGKQLNTTELEILFNRILDEKEAPSPYVGYLTSQNRDVWTKQRTELLNSAPENAQALKDIESSAFVVCLDASTPITLEGRAHTYWHGPGNNRFYDKPLQFIVCANAAAGFMGEHSMMDGTPTHRLNDYVNNVIFNNKLDFSDPTVRSNLPAPKELKFSVPRQFKDYIEGAKQAFQNEIRLHELEVQAYQGYGKGLIKKFRCSPDAYVQMIIQLAYYKMYGVSRPTYESAATRRFQQGRTETCRTVSEASVAWVKAMQDLDADNETRVALFRKAIDSHLEYISAASDGKGVDRHLFGLKRLLEPGQEVPEIYKDEAYSYSSSWYLSTSQLSSEYFNGYGWSQVIDNGFGIAYMINENSINFNIVSKRKGSKRMAYYLSEAAGEMRDLMMPTVQAPKAKL
ncbi:acyltransferase ChoActase/COT/CPT [Bombardia bombarda]|uniref:Carnitine O-acetyltransferase, mitochondrial n=1 Tax=Bombardia bombarda TaxID=252184 RepID=A0AA40CGR0_9PEZI|nr:acyltransferase ChoActase/COT/CPT [Bombardia bombarda]